MRKPSPELEQIHVGLSSGDHKCVADCKAAPAAYEQEQEIAEAHLLNLCPSNIWPKGSYRNTCPRPIIVTKEHQQQLEELHGALTTAITDIVERWWTDDEARFPERMPLEKQEAELLQWLSDKSLHYRHCQGSWRPDFMVEDHEDKEGNGPAENFRITEINARFSFNGFMHQALGHETLERMGVGSNGLISTATSEDLFGGLLGLFKHDLPLHLLRNEEPGMDFHMFLYLVQHRFGLSLRAITPADLRVLPDPQSKSGYKLCCLIKQGAESTSSTNSPSTLVTEDGEAVEEVHQVGLEVNQRELASLPTEVLRQLSLRCFNDMRTLLLTHDKRMLGIVKQELKSLVARNVLTLDQAHVLDKGIADSILPGSPSMNKLLSLTKENPELRKQYLLKPVRGGNGAGITFGEECKPDEWIEALQGLRCAELKDGSTFVVQRRIYPHLYDLVLKPSGARVHYPLVGTYHVTQGKLLGFGTWRSSPRNICAVSQGGSWICTVMKDESTNQDTCRNKLPY